MTEETTRDFNQEIENEIIEKGLTAPRVTKAHIDALYDKLEFSLGRVSPNRVMCSAILDGFTIADGFGGLR